MERKKSNSGTVDGRYRNFATVVYPDSAPDGWQEILAGLFVPAFVSPLHDKDVNPGGEAKKPHWHVLLMFEGKKSESQVNSLLQSFGGVGCEIVQSLRGYARYLCHLDNPEKAQYDPEKVRCMGGSDYSGVIGLATDKYKAVREMILYCVEHDIVSYAELLTYASIERADWFRVLCDSGTLVVSTFLKSRAWENGNIR